LAYFGAIMGPTVMHRQFNEQHLKRRARYLSELEIREVSSVDRAANPGARASCY
jgi:hypothetical protein